MKILLVGDIHFRSKRLKDISEAWKKILEAAKKAGVDIILQAGDIYDVANIHTKEADVGTVYDAFVTPLKESGIPFLCVLGNHDIGQAKDKDALATIDKFDWVKVMRKPCVYALDQFQEHLKGVSVCAVPWLYKEHLVARMKLAGHDGADVATKVDGMMSNLMEQLSEHVKEHQKNGNYVIFLGHLEVTGAKRDNGQLQSGGTFEYSPKQLMDTNADAFGLAHIHVRQSIAGLPNPNDGYIGNLCQLSFGEEASTPGVRIIEVVDGKLVADKLIENTTSPRYFTVESLDGLNYRKGIDQVKVRGDIRPEDLPEGVIFEKNVKLSDRDISEGCLNCDTPIEDLLKEWKEVSKCSLELSELVAGANELFAQAKIPSDSIGSLDRINYITLKNITSHKDTHLDLTTLSGICGIEGSNGSGKTTTIEAILVALFGECPSRPFLPSLITQGCDEPAVLEVGFTSKGIEYKVRREFKSTTKTFSHVANLWRIASGEDGEDELLAGPKVAAVDNQCKLMVGDPKLVLAGVFASQGDAGNIIDLKPTDRKLVFAKLLGTDKFLILADFAKKMVSAVNAEIEAVLAKALRLENEAADEKQDSDALDTTKVKIEASENAIKDKELILEETNKELQEIMASNKSIEAIQSQVVKQREKRAKIVEQGKAGKVKLTEIKKIIGLDLKDELQKISDAKTELESLRKIAQQVTEEKNALIAQALEHKKTASDLSANANATYTKYLSEINSKNDVIRKAFSEKRSTVQGKHSKLDYEYRDLLGRLQEAKKKAKLIEGFPNQDICKKCPLAEDGIAGRESIIELESKLSEVQLLLAQTLNELTSLGEAKLDSLVSQEEFCAEIYIKSKAELTTANELEKKSAGLTVSNEVKEKAQALKAIIAGEEALRKKAEEVANASTEAAKLEGSLKELVAQIAEIDEYLRTTPVPSKIEETSQRNVIAETTKEFNALKEVMKTLLIDQGRLETAMSNHAKRKTEAKELRAGIEAKENAVKVMNALISAFGKDGIPQMIVDSAIPHFQDLMATQMMDFEGRWVIQVASQKENKDGSIKEVISIIVDDGDGEREISTYSGGERKLLKAIIRIAFSTLMAQRSGNGLKILVLDEATDSMDESNAGNFIKMLGRLSNMFNQVYVVSHNDRILSTIQNRLEFNRQPGHYTTLTKKGNW